MQLLSICCVLISSKIFNILVSTAVIKTGAIAHLLNCSTSACSIILSSFVFSSFVPRMKTSRFRHLCQRSRQSPSCRQGRTGAWTRLWRSSGKRPGNDWWQRSERRQYDRTPPQKAPTASKSTSPRPRPDSENGLAPRHRGTSPDPFRISSTQHKLIWTRSTTDAQRSSPHHSTADDRSVEITGQHTDLHPPAMGLNHPARCLTLLLLLLLLLLLRL